MTNFLVTCPTAESVALSARDWIVHRIRESIEARERCVVALSGGSTPKRLYELLAELPEDTVDWSRVHLVWGDERNVPLDHPDSNFGMVRTVLLNPLGKQGPNVYPVPVDPDSPEKTAEYYEATLRSLLCNGNRNRFPVIDVVLLGLGDDSHTASLFPHSTALTEKQKWVVANPVEKLNTVRITMTAPLLNAGRDVAFLVCGKGKQSAIGTIWHGEQNTARYPAQLIQPTPGNLWWFLDTDALGDNLMPSNIETATI